MADLARSLEKNGVSGNAAQLPNEQGFCKMIMPSDKVKTKLIKLFSWKLSDATWR